MSRKPARWKWAAGAAIVLVLIYASDSAYLRLRVAYPGAGEAFGTVRMQRLYAIPQKNGKIEYEFDALQPEVTEPCVRSLFGHLGKRPCWRLERGAHKPIPMVIMWITRP